MSEEELEGITARKLYEAYGRSLQWQRMNYTDCTLQGMARHVEKKKLPVFDNLDPRERGAWMEVARDCIAMTSTDSEANVLREQIARAIEVANEALVPPRGNDQIADTFKKYLTALDKVLRVGVAALEMFQRKL